MKKTFLLIAFALFSVLAFAQFEVQSSGFSTSSNITMDGVMGINNGYNGVLMVKSNKTDIYYNSLYGYALGLIRTDCGGFSGVFPYSNINRDIMNFYVKANGQVYSYSGFLQPSATLSKSRSAMPSLTSSLEKLSNINGVVYTIPAGEAKGRSVFTDEGSSTALADSATSAGILNRISDEENLPRFGLVAQELEQVFPEVVRTLPDGSKGILYSDLIPVLIESIKELQAKVNVLESRLSNPAPENAPQKSKQSSTEKLGQGEAGLYQNTPNPFNRETEIIYRLSADASVASICIYNLNGHQLKKYPLAIESLNGKITLSASEFTPGMYIYALVINNQMIDSKRMTLTD